MKSRKLKLAIAALVVFGAIGAGVGWAAWSASGSGSGAGGATVAQTLTVNAVTPSGAGASLYPGGPAGWVYFSISNPNPYAISITHISWGTPTSTSTASCPSANISLDPSAPSTLSLSIPANGTSGTFQVFNVLDLAHSAPDGCQGVAFNVPVTVTGTQS